MANTHHGYSVERLEEPAVVPSAGSRFFTGVRRVLGPGLNIVAWILQLNLLALIWRAARRSDAGTIAFLVPYAFLAIQVVALVAKFAEEGWRYLCLSPYRRNRLRLPGDVVPRVDIIITTCGEELDIILDTVSAACALEYPADRFRIVVSDDGASETLEKAVTSLANISKPQLIHFARTSKDGAKKGAKSGNMNAALAHVDSFGEAAEYIAVCDADMILEPAFLRATLPHLVTNPRAALAVIPQFFYNIPLNDPLNQSLNTQGRLDGAQRDSIECAWNTGPGAVFRRKALREIGGFPEDALCEDVMTGWLLNGQAWINVHVPEALQWGLQPDTLAGHVAQRCKWSVGMARNARTSTFGFSPSLLPAMTWRQRIICFTHCASPYFVAWKFLRTWLLLALIATRNPLLSPSIFPYELHRMIFLTWLLACIARVEDLLGGISAGSRALRRRKQGGWWLAPYQYLAILHELLPTKLGGRRIAFVPTAVSESEVRERDAATRPGTWKRFKLMALGQMLWYHVFMLTVAGLLLGRGASRTPREDTTAGPWFYLLTHVVVPGTDWENLTALLTPLAYALWPPTMPTRRAMMELCNSGSIEEGFEVWRPTPHSKAEKWDVWMALHELPHLLSFAFWTFVCFSAVFR